MGLKKEWCGDSDKSTSLGTFRALEYSTLLGWLRSEARFMVCHRLALKQSLSPSLSPWMLEHQTNTTKRTCSCLPPAEFDYSQLVVRSGGAFQLAHLSTMRQIGLITVPRII